ncbi:hypothetical protein M8J75_011945 [Diaphorina citri]|nr:hypothetical protein M8J75_011945 [Diaphorina citri]
MMKISVVLCICSYIAVTNKSAFSFFNSREQSGQPSSLIRPNNHHYSGVSSIFKRPKFKLNRDDEHGHSGIYHSNNKVLHQDDTNRIHSIRARSGDEPFRSSTLYSGKFTIDNDPLRRGIKNDIFAARYLKEDRTTKKPVKKRKKTKKSGNESTTFSGKEFTIDNEPYRRGMRRDGSSTKKLNYYLKEDNLEPKRKDYIPGKSNLYHIWFDEHPDKTTKGKRGRKKGSASPKLASGPGFPHIKVPRTKKYTGPTTTEKWTTPWWVFRPSPCRPVPEDPGD